MAEPSKPIAEGDGTEYELNPVVSPNPGQICPTGVHVERYVPGTSKDDINNAGSDPKGGDLQRSGGSPDDPDGGHELLGREWRGPDPDPVDELVPGGQCAEPRPYGAIADIEGTADGGEPDTDAEKPELVKHEGIIRPDDEEVR